MIGWGVGFGILVAAEMATGTFYLLMLALGCAAGAVAAGLGLALPLQVAFGALVGVGATVAWHLQRKREPASRPAQSNPDVVLDIGQQLHVTAWAGDGSARVNYRGASWSAQYAGRGTPAPGEFRISAIHGSVLQLVPVDHH
ncbi:MAG: NfeD family protein [Burkholderiales bacterium]|nr:NfeD family protein [Burkholderiales bacterium]MDE1928035.1 NfeD family protein [Burkholderiales bacterium]MDE2159399.1 NfeD family protein [Burkholderiales bacterium]MDE2502860.1 NfeD family protein [Burkholderiales bacterium]